MCSYHAPCSVHYWDLKSLGGSEGWISIDMNIYLIAKIAVSTSTNVHQNQSQKDVNQLDLICLFDLVAKQSWFHFIRLASFG